MSKKTPLEKKPKNDWHKRTLNSNKKIELHTIAIGGLVNKAMLETINEKNDKILKALADHDKFTNMQLAELREKIEVEIEGKIVGLQTETRQRFTEQDGKITGLQTEMRQHFAQVETIQQEHTTALTEQKSLLTEILSRLPEKQ